MASSTTSQAEAPAYGGATVQRARVSGWRKKLRGYDWVLFILFMAPNLFFLALFTYWPMVRNVSISLHQTNTLFLSTNSVYVGLANFKYIFTDSQFIYVLENTLYFTVASVTLTIVFGLLAALLLNQKLRFRDGVRAIVFAPTLLSGAAIGIVWAYIFNPQYGLIAKILSWVNLTSPDWLNQPHWAMPAIIIVYVWKNLGFAAVIFLAGLQAIPDDFYDAAKVDGANAWWRFRSVTLPMLSPISFFLLVTSVLATFQAFDIQRTMTGGGPAYSTTTLIYYVYDQGFGNAFNYGRAAAAAIVLFILMLIVTVLQVRFSQNQVHYDS